MGLPLLFTAACTIQANSASAPNVEALRNTLKTPIEISEIRFALSNTPDNSTAYVGGAGVGVSLAIGELGLTGGFIPVFNFGKAEQVGQDEPIGSGTTDFYSDYYWRLPRPILVPPGEVVAANFEHRGLVPAPVTARVSYFGKTSSAKYGKETQVDIPWVSSWVSKTMTTYSTTGETDESTENDIVTPRGRVIRLQRFTGRVNNTLRSTQVNDDLTFALNTHQLLQVKMSDSAGNPLVKDWSYFYNVFSSMTRTWECGGIQVPADVFHKVYLNKKAASTDASSSGARVFQAYVSAVGWYRAKLKEIG